jgi:microcystin-dependent protein
MPNYTRPDLPYTNVAQPNDNRFVILTEQNRPPTAELFDAELNARVDADNDLQDQIDNLAVGILPGSDNPLNDHKIPTTDGAGNISFIFIGADNIQDESIGSDQLAEECITVDELADAAVTGPKVAQKTIAEANMADGAASTRVIPNGAITPAKITDNTLPGAKILDTSMNGAKLTDNTVPAAKIIDNSIPNAKMLDNSLTGAKMVAETVTNREISSLCTWKAGDLKMSVAEAPSPGFLNCSGGLFNRVTYAALFAAIGTKFGAGDGNTTFAVPDFRGRAPVGFDYTQSGLIGATGSNVTNVGNDPNGNAPYTIAYQGGEQTHALTANENGPHTHQYNHMDTAVIAYASAGGDRGIYYTLINDDTASSGLGDAHNNLQPYVYSIMWIYAGV